MTFNTDFIIKSKPKLKKIIGLRNIVTDGKEWKYLLFYDVDNQSEENIKVVIGAFNSFRISFIVYKTKHGIHGVGFTPLSITRHAVMFHELQNLIPEYYSGQTIRLSRRENETQELLGFNFDYPILKNLLSIYMKRFTSLYISPIIPDSKLIEGYSLVFEKYWSTKV